MNIQKTDETIGHRLREIRKQRGFHSARAFAREYDIPESTYSQHETGKRSLSAYNIKRYCQWLNIDANWLLLGKPAPSAD